MYIHDNVEFDKNRFPDPCMVQMRYIQEIVSAIRKLKAEEGLKHNDLVDIYIRSSDDFCIATVFTVRSQEMIKYMAGISKLIWVIGEEYNELT